MALWEYKVITSGRGGFATPALLESYLNQLGKEEWEIVEFRTQPDNALAFQGLVRRPTQRDWTLEAAAAAAAKVEADKLRAEFAAKYQSGTTGTALVEEKPAAMDTVNRDDSFRRPVDTEHDQDPYAIDDSAVEEEEIPEEDQLPTFFDAIRPHMRRNQRGPGYSVGLDYLVKRFEMLEDDLLTALKECGFPIPEDEDDKPFYIEYDGDIYWLNVNRRGELWLNTREKPRAVFKTVKGTPLSPEVLEEAAPAETKPDESVPRQDPRRQRDGRGDRNERRGERRSRQDEAPTFVPKPADEPVAPVAVAGDASPVVPTEAPDVTLAEGRPAVAEAAPAVAPVVVVLPSGNALLAKLRPLMRRSRGGLSGTISFLARALHQSEADLTAALAEIGLRASAGNGEKAPVVESDDLVYWLNRDGRGGMWINVRERRETRETKVAEPTVAPAETPAPVVPPVVSAAPADDPAVVVPVAPQDEAPSSPAPTPTEIPVAGAQVIPFPQEAETAAPVAAESAPAMDEAPTLPDLAQLPGPLAAVRLFLKNTRTGALAAKAESLAQILGKGEGEFLTALTDLGLKVPEKSREKPVFIEHGGEIYWFNKSAKGDLWLNAKAAKYTAKDGGAEGDNDPRPRRSRSRRKPAEGSDTADVTDTPSPA